MTLQKIINKISIFLWRIIGFRIRNFYQSIINLIDWFPIIWKDKNWDYTHIYDILEFKLRRQAKYIGKNNNHTMTNKDARNMLICANLISKIKDEYYDTEYLDYDFDDYFKKYKRVYDEIIKGGINIFNQPLDINDKQQIAWTMGYRIQAKAERLLYKILKENIKSWWD